MADLFDSCEEMEEGTKSHTCTFSCPEIQGEFVGTGSARASNESRRQAFLALYESLPTSLEDLIIRFLLLSWTMFRITMYCYCDCVL